MLSYEKQGDFKNQHKNLVQNIKSETVLDRNFRLILTLGLKKWMRKNYSIGPQL